MPAQLMALPKKTVGVNARAFEYYRPLGRLKRYIDVNYSQEISLLHAARIAALERSYFSTFFRKKVGINFRDWLRQVRVAKAMELFEQQDCSISEVAFAVGFADLSTFERAFKKVTSMTPSQYKRSVLPEAGI
ncbi:MAG: AraC family transcriptional regulator [Acidobacteria bacterium]|nr:MAG: AraC family transcriptional regulator [Acidobacteriota bacterium]